MAETYTAPQLQLEVALYILGHYKEAREKLGGTVPLAALLVRARAVLQEHFSRKLEAFEEHDEEETMAMADNNAATAGGTAAPQPANQAPRTAAMG